MEDRKIVLLGRCYASLFQFSDCATVIGIGTNVPGQMPDEGYSTDKLMLQKKVKEWPSDYLEMGRYFRDEVGFFKKRIGTHTREDEYPTTS